MLNLAWVRGLQNRDFDIGTKSWVTSNLGQHWKVRTISNIMLPVIRRNVSQLIQTTPQWDVVPATTDEEDLETSRISTKTLVSYWQKLVFYKLLIRIGFWQSCCSSAFAKVSWNPNKGDEVEIETELVQDETMKLFMEFAGISIKPKTIKKREGDACVSLVTPFNILFDNVAVVEDSVYYIETNLRTQDWIVENFGNKWKDNLTGSSESSQLYLSPLLFFSNRELVKNTVVVHEFMVKESRVFPRGLHAIYTDGGQALKPPQKNPFDHGDLNIAQFMEIYDPTSIWGNNTAEQIRPEQAVYNRVRSSIMENINLTANIQWTNPKGSTVTQLTNRPGAVFHHTAGKEPKQMQPKGMPTYVESFLARTRADMQDTASSHDVSEGKAEPGVRSGRAVLALQDSDDTVKGPVLLWWDLAVARTGRLLLQTLTQFLSTERLLETTGDFNEIETFNVIGADLKGKGKGDYFKVRVKTFGRQAISRSAREGMVKVLLDLQILNPVAHKDLLLNILGAGDFIQIYDRAASDRIRQAKEIRQIEAGEKVQVYTGQNHDAHKEAIKKFISSSAWDKLDPQIKQQISLHLIEHIKIETLEVAMPRIFLAQTLGVQQNGTSGQQRPQSSGQRPQSGTKNRQPSRTARQGAQRKAS